MENQLAQNSTRQNALRDIRMALEEACTRHNLPLAQTWTNVGFKGCTPYVLCTTSYEYYQSQLGFSIFRDTCESFHLSFGGGVVWKAFGSGGSCFCRDIGRLSIADYSFSHVARKAMLTASFAICLKSHSTHDTEAGDSDVYVLELFLPSATSNPRELLELVLLTMKKHLGGFVIGSGQKLGSGGMNVDVLKVLSVSEDHDDKEECFFQLFPGGLEQINATDNGETSQAPVVEYQESLESFNCWDIGLFTNDASMSTTSASFGWREDHSFDTPSMKETGSTSYNTSTISTSRFPHENDSKREWSLFVDPMTFGFSSADIFGGGAEMDIVSETKGVTSSASHLPPINRETIEKHYGLRLKDAARSLKVSPATLKRRCRDAGIPSWPRKKINSSSIDSGEHNIEMINERKCDDGFLPLPASTTSNEHHSASQVPAMPISRFMIIKARYGKNIMIKFQLPFSSQLLHMETEVAFRLKLEMGSFKIWYVDEDDEFILLTCDADLRTMESMGKSTIRVCVTLGDSAPE